MGQKVHPIGFRLGVYRTWEARWYADKDYTKLLHEDLAMRRLIMGRLRNAGVARIETERSANQLTVIIQTAKPGIVIGKQGASVDALRDELERISGKKVRVTIHEIKQPELDAKLVAENVASQLEKRIAFRRAIKQTLLRSMRAGAKGVKIQVSGRLGGSEMSRREWDREGRVPLHTLRANIDYGQAEARTTFGRIGVQCWLYKGDFVTATGEPILPQGFRAAEEDEGDGRAAAQTPTRAAPRRVPAGRAAAPAAAPVETPDERRTAEEALGAADAEATPDVEAEVGVVEPEAAADTEAETDNDTDTDTDLDVPLPVEVSAEDSENTRRPQPVGRKRPAAPARRPAPGGRRPGGGPPKPAASPEEE